MDKNQLSRYANGFNALEIKLDLSDARKKSNKLSIIYLKVGSLFLFAALVMACTGPQNSNISTTLDAQLSMMTCYKTFDEFAYDATDSGLPVVPLLPTKPWQIETTFPGELDKNIHVQGLDVMFARSVNGSSEIWLARPTRHLKDDRSVFVYRPISKDWEFIPDVIEGTDVFISDIFLASDGSIWGHNIWEWGNTDSISGPVLSKFNEQTRQFEFAEGALEIPYNDEQKLVNVEIILDQQSIWLFVENDGLYRYDPISRNTTKQIALLGINGTSPVLSGDGSIYFKDNNFQKYASNYPSFSIFEKMFFQFMPDSGELINLENPDEPWPVFGRMFVTKSEQLWLGSIGYRESDGSWHLVHPNPDRYFEHSGDIAWISPNIVLQSSNGLFWLKKFTDSGLHNEGTAWYDPENGEGCMFTNIPANIIEDSQHQLWMFADGKLYKYSLGQ